MLTLDCISSGQQFVAVIEEINEGFIRNWQKHIPAFSTVDQQQAW